MDKPGSTIHYFRDRLAWSAELSDEPSWTEFYRRIWPDMISCVRLDGKSDLQLRGVDRVIFRANGIQPIRVDEKKRDKDHGDILLEVWDQVPLVDFDEGARRVLIQPRKRGWASDPGKVCDFIVYAIIPAGRAYLLPFELLRLTLERNFLAWKRVPKAYPIPSRNPTYWTINIAVKWPVLVDAIAETMLLRFGGATTALPDPLMSGTQTTFAWSAP